MRRLIRVWLPCLLAVSILFAGQGCKRSRKPRVETIEEPGALASRIQVADPKYSAQLMKGFHEGENSWRWTRSQFSVALRTPEGAINSGARLEMNLAIPQAVIDKVRATTLSATINSVQLAPEKYDKSGQYTFTRDVPASAFTSDAATIDFSVDRYLAAGEVEMRELGVIVSEVALVAK